MRVRAVGYGARLGATALLVSLLSACGGSSESGGLRLQMLADRAVVDDGRSQLVFARSGWSAQWQDAQGRLIVRDAPATGTDTQSNPDYASNDDVANGIDRAYPGTPEISYRPWSYLTAQGWQRVTGWSDLQVQGDRIELQAQTSDGAGAVLSYRFAADGSIEAHFRPLAAAVAAVSTAWDSPAAQRYFGGGQRFSAFNLRGTSLPLWISHGPNREQPELLAVDAVVLCAGQEPERGLSAKLTQAGIPHHLIGGADVAAELDAKRAINQAARLAARL